MVPVAIVPMLELIPKTNAEQIVASPLRDGEKVHPLNVMPLFFVL